MKTFIAIKDDETRATFLNEDNMALLKSFGTVRETHGELTAQNIAAQIGDSEVFMTGWGSPRLGREILDGAPALKLLVHLCGTVAPYISDTLFERGVRVISGNAYFAQSTAEGALAYILSAQRNIPFYSTELKEKRRWKAENAPNYGVAGKTVGVVSFGAVAGNLIKLLQPFNVKILVYDVVPIPDAEKEKYGITQVSLEELFSSADIISVHAPLNSGTHGLITKNLFELIKPDALFVNTSRGEIIDEEALTDLLYERRFRAVLDVFGKEPIPQNSRLFEAPGLMLMPHMAGPAFDFRKEIARRMILESHAFIDEGKALVNEITFAQAAKMSEH